VELYIHSPNTPSWRGAQLKHRDSFTFTFTLVVAAGHYIHGHNRRTNTTIECNEMEAVNRVLAWVGLEVKFTHIISISFDIHTMAEKYQHTGLCLQHETSYLRNITVSEDHMYCKAASLSKVVYIYTVS
jgi:hypothetical protein